MTERAEFTASDGTRLVVHEWRTTGVPRAKLLVLHGVAEHGGRYEAFAGRLQGDGIQVLACDHRGHGRSGGPRVHVERWQRYLDDARELLTLLDRTGADAPLFVYGHSMGALICVELAIESAGPTASDGVRGWIASGAGIEPTGIARPHLVAIARLLSGIVPRFRLALGIPAEALSHAPDVVGAYRDDPLVESRATVRWGTEALSAIDRIKTRAGSIRGPLLVLHGSADPLAEAAGSKWLADEVGDAATLIIYEGALHEPHNDPGFGDVPSDVVAWIERHV